MHSRLPKMTNVAKTLNAISAVLPTYVKHRIANVLAEGFDREIQAPEANPDGIRSSETTAPKSFASAAHST